MSKDKTFQEKLKSMFRTKKDPIVIPPNREFILTSEILHDLGKDSATNTRVKTMKELTAHLSRLETNGVEKLWSCIQDMFLREYPNDVRNATFSFLQSVIKSQFERIYVMRAQFFRFIKHHDNAQDIAPRVDLLAALTNDGKEVEHFEEEIGPFLLNWFPDVSRISKLNEFLKILDNVIKFNSPHLDEYTMTGYVKHVCVLCCNTNQFPIVILCLQILGTVVAYSILPPESLSQFVGTLCRTVNIKCYCSASWKTMKNLLGTHLGHSTLYTMCRFLQEPNLRNDAGLLRGCVFYIHMALWDINSMQNLCCPPSSVLPSVLQAVKANHPSVALEVIIGIQKLINKQGLELLEPTWDIVLEIILHVIKQIELAPNEVPNNLTIITLHEILNTIENLIEVGNYKGSMNQFFAVIHECSRDRPETSVLKLIKFQSKSIRPTESAWLQNLYNLLANYFKPDMRTNVRLKVLSVLEDTIQLYGKVWQYEDELINHIVIPHMQSIATDDNIVVRSEVAKLLVDLCKDYNSNICLELLEILEKLLLRPIEKEGVPTHSPEAELLDICVLVPGLIQVFARKIHKLPSSHAILIFKILVDFLDKNVHKPVKELKHARIMIFECLLSLRADSNCRIGLPDPETKQLKFSPYLCASYKTLEPIVTSPSATSPPLTPVCKIIHLPMELAFQMILTHLEIEKDWEIVKSILDRLPEMLYNKAIMLTQTGNPQINQLVKVLCSMLQNKALNLVDGVNPKEKRLEFQTTVVNVLLALSCYGSNLDPPHQQLLINTLTRSTAIDPRCSRQSINSLTICMVDMRETMMKLLPEVLLRLSKISATMYIAMPVLEFLSALSQLPTVFANFVGDQYMAVFAIALPYTNPFKYDNYIVSLAYHVISVWFLKCRLPFRKDFVKFIVSGLQTNVMVPFQELSQFKLSLSSMNQDSSDRKRSSSLTEQGSRRRIKPETSSKSTFIQKTPRDKTVLTFYEELNETCIDLMARYTYSPCSALPKRLPTAEFLLNGGITKSWMLGNKLITITTSGCTEKVLKHGVCDKCWSLCSSHNNSKIARYARSNSGNEEKESFLPRQSSTDKGEEVKKYDAASLAKMIGEEKREPPICACWCQGWAEVLIRRPTGNVSWVMKVQNQVSFKQHIYEFPLNEMSSLFMPDLFFEPSSAISIEEQEETEDPADAACSSSSRPVSVPGSPNIQKSSSSSKLEKNRGKSGEPSLAEKRDRLHTISVMSTSTRKPTPPKKVPKEILKSGLNPSFVFLQLYHTACFGSTAEVPLSVPPTAVIDRAINILDRMYPYEVHKIGVLYINEGQVDKESDILRNTSGCIRYMEFLQNLGTLIKLADVNPRDIYLGGVDQGGADGKYMYTHQDDLVQLAFHVATLMPNRENDPNGYYKKAHVGNDNVVIIYNNSGQEFDINTFKSQVTLACIIVEPLDYGCNKVEVKVKSDLLKTIGSNEVISVSDQSVSILVRQLAIHADLAATVLNSLRSHATDPYASNWLERLRKLKNLREKVIQELKKVKESGNQKGPSEEKNTVEDFTDFT